MQAEAQPAPYGRGEETLMDRDVRRTWQVDAKQLTIEGEGWLESLKRLVSLDEGREQDAEVLRESLLKLDSFVKMSSAQD